MNLPSSPALLPQERGVNSSSLVPLLPQEKGLGDEGLSVDEVILDRLVTLNAQRAEEERNGLVRWLRPDYQAPQETQVQQTLEGITAPDEPIPVVQIEQLPFPKSFKDQLSAIRDLLRTHGGEWTATQIIAQFKNATRQKRAILESLESLEDLGIFASRRRKTHPLLVSRRPSQSQLGCVSKAQLTLHTPKPSLIPTVEIDRSTPGEMLAATVAYILPSATPKEQARSWLTAHPPHQNESSVDFQPQRAVLLAAPVAWFVPPTLNTLETTP
jgi:hypothetical protein